MQDGPVRITGETDRIYLKTAGDGVIEDTGLNREIRIKKSGSNSTVVWNPWEAKTRGMKDLGDRDYTKFLCVKTTNAGDDTVMLPPSPVKNTSYK